MSVSTVNPVGDLPGETKIWRFLCTYCGEMLEEDEAYTDGTKFHLQEFYFLDKEVTEQILYYAAYCDKACKVLDQAPGDEDDS